MDTKTHSQVPPTMRSIQRKRSGSILIIAILIISALYTLRVPCFDSPGFSLDINTHSGPVVASHTRNVAVIIEDRPLKKLAPLMLHFSSVLGPDWPVVLYTTRENVMPDSAPLVRAMNEGRIAIRFLPSDVRFSKDGDVSEFLTLPWIWQELAPAGHVLVFQADSIICSSSPLRVEDFLHYDFVGAPIDPTLGQGEGFNGGLSLRNRSMVLNIVTKSSWYAERNHAKDISEPGIVFSDQWLYAKMKKLPPQSDGVPGARLPSIEVAKTFSVETVWYETPLGYHQVAAWQKYNMQTVDDWCPEHRISTTELVRRSSAFD